MIIKHSAALGCLVTRCIHEPHVYSCVKRWLKAWVCKAPWISDLLSNRVPASQMWSFASKGEWHFKEELLSSPEKKKRNKHNEETKKSKFGGLFNFFYLSELSCKSIVFLFMGLWSCYEELNYSVNKISGQWNKLMCWQFWMNLGGVEKAKHTHTWNLLWNYLMLNLSDCC